MTVKKLIEELKKLPQDFEVVARECKYEYGFVEVNDYVVDNIADIAHSNREVVISISD